MSKLGGNVNPIPQGKYVPAARFGNLIYTAGMTPRNNGVLIQSGKVSAEQPGCAQCHQVKLTNFRVYIPSDYCVHWSLNSIEIVNKLSRKS